MLLIKGYFDELSFVEILKVISKHDGRLGIWDIENRKQYEFTFQKGNVIQVNLNSKQILEVENIREFISVLVEDKKSYYFFNKEKMFETKTPIITTVDLLNFALTNQKAEVAEEIYLPNLETVFETVNKISFVLQGELESFWNATIDMLHRGCSGAEICNKFGYDEKYVRESLYKLRTIGLVVPVRAFKPIAPKLKRKMIGKNLKAIAANRAMKSKQGTASHPASLVKEMVGVAPSNQEAVQNHQAEKLANNDSVSVSPNLTELESQPTVSPNLMEQKPAVSPNLAEQKSQPTLESEQPQGAEDMMMELLFESEDSENVQSLQDSDYSADVNQPVENPNDNLKQPPQMDSVSNQPESLAQTFDNPSNDVREPIQPNSEPQQEVKQNEAVPEKVFEQIDGGQSKTVDERPPLTYGVEQESKKKTGLFKRMLNSLLK